MLEILAAIKSKKKIVLAPQITVLERLNLSGKSIGEGASVLSDFLKSNSTITTLNLRCTKIGDEGACALSDSLKSNSTLTTLDLRSNSIGDLGVRSLSDALTSNSSLTHLDLESMFNIKSSFLRN